MNKKIIIYTFAIILVIINFVIDFNINSYIKILNKCFNQNIIISNLYYAIICFIIALISILIMACIKLVIYYKKDEIKGIKLKKEDGTHGTADWMSEDEIEKVLGKNETPGIILGKLNNDIIKLPFDSYFNKNIAVFGSSGSKKSRGFAIPNGIELVQEEVQEAIQRQMSLVFTDPKGELYRKLAKYLETKGYDVEVFNLVNPTFSNGARFINFVEDETDAQIFSQIVIEGTQLSRRSSGDEFWNRGEQNLLKALLLYVINYIKKEEDKSMGFIYDALASGNIK